MASSPLRRAFAATGKTANQRAVEGMDDVMANLNREIAAIENRTSAGLLAAGLIVQGESQRRVPVEYGNLRGSAFTRKTPESELVVEVGYGADYAVYVHENLEQVLKGKPRPSGIGVYWGPEGEPKFLENAAREKEGEILETVAAYAEVK